jgi:cell division protein FtsQ
MISETGHPGSEQDRRYWRRRVNRHVRKKRRTRVLLRWTGIVLANLAVASILVVSAASAIRHLTSCSELSLQTVEVLGTSKTTPAAIRATLARFTGRNLLEMDLEDVVAAARTDPWVRGATAKRILPHAVRVTIVERTPAAMAVLSGAAHVIDEEGFDIGPAGPGLTYDLPVLTGIAAADEGARRGELARGAAVVARLRASASPFLSRISEIDLSKPDRVGIVTSTPGPRILLDPAQVERNLDDYFAIAGRIEGKIGPAEIVDLRWSHRISVLPVEDLPLPRSK